MMLPAALEMEQEPSPMASEQELLSAALEQMSLPMCNGFKLLFVALE